ncbi:MULTISPECIES: low temperature requirement protein A [unclassified Frankia]|uniref:low temperature requirement protein A n=1 Tax=unclassified Frankia TaxID=2632575 RepID=UPI002AD365BB|nr:MULTISPECIES: low temperature requirement protein A [unclassified Frankia]
MSDQEKRVAWVELFFDLVFVVAVTQVSSLLHTDHSWSGAARALVVFIPIYWAWVGMTMHANLHDVDRTRARLAVFAVGLCGLFMALALPEAYRSRGLLFGVSYWAARLLLYALMRRSYRGVGFNPFTVAAFVTGPLLALGGLTDGRVRVALWALAAGVDLFVPVLARRRMTRIAYEPSHLPERFGLFLIIALGESVAETGVVAGRQPATLARLAAVAAAFALACALWWVYFVFAAGAIRYAVRTAEVAIDVIRPVLPYGHLGFIGGIIAIAAATGEVIMNPLAHPHTDTAALLFGGAALYLATFGYTRWRMFRTVSTARLSAAALCLAALPLTGQIPALAAMTALTVVVVALNVWEARTVPRQEPLSGIPQM